MRTPLRDRLLAGTGAAIVILLFGYLILLGLTVTMQNRIEQKLTLLDLRPPPPEQQRKPPVEHPKSKAAAHASSPRNLKNKATEVVVPPPAIPLPAPQPIIAALRPGSGMAGNTGASDRPGPGDGAGGEGDGSGGGGDGGDDVPPRQIKGHLKFSDLPPDLRDTGISGTVSVRYYVESDGSVGGCAITASSGNTELDAVTCQLIQQRFHFRPLRDPDGKPVRSVIVENHSWGNDDPPPPRNP